MPHWFPRAEVWQGPLIGVWLAAVLFSLVSLFGSMCSPIHDEDGPSVGGTDQDASVCEPNSCSIRSHVLNQ